MVAVAMTGGIAVGKTVMMAYWNAQFDIPIFDTDDIGRSLLKQDMVKNELLNLFGKEVFLANGDIDRVAIQGRIFTHAKERDALESILHPLIRQESQALIDQFSKKYPYCIVIVPLLFETKTADSYERVCVVESGLDQRIRRCFDRGLSESVTLAILHAQATSEQRLSIADDVLYNVKDFGFFYTQIDQFFKRYDDMFSV